MKKFKAVLGLKKFKVANLNELHKLRGGDDEGGIDTGTQGSIFSTNPRCPSNRNGCTPPPPPPTTGGGNGSGVVAIDHL